MQIQLTEQEKGLRIKAAKLVRTSNGTKRLYAVLKDGTVMIVR
jgi:hypothetical protein